MFCWCRCCQQLEEILDRVERILRSINSRVFAIDMRTSVLVEDFQKNLEILKKIHDWQRSRWGPRKPETPTIVVVQEDHMADMLVFNVLLPPWPQNTDIVKGVLWVKTGDTDHGTVDVAFGSSTAGPFSGPQDSEVSLKFWYVDDAGNTSEPSFFSTVLIDTVPPPGPGNLGIQVVGEVFPSAPTEPEPPAAPEPDPEDPGDPHVPEGD